MQNELDYKNIQKIGLVSRIGTNLDKEILYLNEILKEKKVQLLLLKNSSSSLNLPSFEIDELFKQSDFVISLGGDGTLISLSKKAFEFNKAILGINAGKLGFLTDFKVEKAREFFDEFFMGKFRIEKPFMLDISLENEKEKILKYAFNDVFFFREQNVSMAHFELYRNNKIFNEYNGDGLIVATPAGSTAYNLSANGPIVYTLAQVFILTPICSHSLTQRPIVLPKGFDLEVRAKNCLISIDGHENFKADDFSKIKVGLSEKSVSLIHPKSRDYFQILKEKLHWGH